MRIQKIIGFTCQRDQPTMVMVWPTITANTRSSAPKQTKCQILSGKHFALSTQTFRSPFVRVNQEWLKKAISCFSSTAHWLPKSPDTNYLDYCASGYFGIVRSPIKILKFQLLHANASPEIDKMDRRAIFRQHVMAMLVAKSGHF